MRVNRPRRLLLALFIAAACGLLLVSLLWKPRPDLASKLAALPEVASVRHSGPADAALIVLHIRDWHFVPRDLAALDGLDFEEHLADVERLQADQLAIARYLIKSHGVRSIYSEGLSEEAAPDLRVRVLLLRDLVKLQAASKIDGEGKALQRLTRLEVGLPGRLLEAGEVDNVLPLEDQAALEDARPVKDGKIAFDPAKVDARRRAMVKQLPAQGLAVIILGGSHDLGPYLPAGTSYVQVTPRGYPGE